MKNPIEPNFKTECRSLVMIALSFLAAYYFNSILPGDMIVAFSRDGKSNQSIPWALLAYAWTVLLLVVYLMFMLFPYFKINRQEGKALKEQWHKAKDLSISFFFILQVVAGLILSGQNKILFIALPILFSLLLISFIPTVVKVLNYRKKHPLKLK